MAIIDANIVLRYVLNDHEELSLKATNIIENQFVILPVEAACEVVYVLLKVYHADRVEIGQILTALINENLISVEKPDILLEALDFFSMTTFDFVDCLLWAYNKIDKQAVLTFDIKLKKRLQNNSGN
nr:PIN domain-containing protein [uncultured Desulfobacter sp.]